MRTAIKWTAPLYGIEGQGWFLGFHCFTTSVKVAVFCGASLRPVPPGASKSQDTRTLDIPEDDRLMKRSSLLLLIPDFAEFNLGRTEGATRRLRPGSLCTRLFQHD